MDHGKFKYEQAKKTRAAKKKQHSSQVKEVKLRPKIDDHDYKFKVNNARKFLGQHHKVKLTIMFRGREMARKERGFALLEQVIKDLSDIGQLEHPPKLEGRNLTTMMSPQSSKGRTTKSQSEGGGEAGATAAPAGAEAGGAPPEKAQEASAPAASGGEAAAETETPAAEPSA